MVNEQWGRALREWILFAVGVTMLMGVAAKALVQDEPVDVTLVGIALILVGVGNEVLKRGAP